MRWMIRTAWIPLLVAIALPLQLGCGGAAAGPGPSTPPVTEPPKIQTQPQSQVVWSGTPVTFSVQASGGGTLAYQWNRNGAAIPGATLDTYHLGSTAVSDHGSTFAVTVSNAAGSATSATATLTVNEKPSIQQQPGDLSVLEGQPASFHVQAQGTPVLHYQWKRNGTVIPGATGPDYSIAAAGLGDNGAYFTVEVSNALDTAVSQPARLSVAPLATPPTITQQPTGMDVMVGQTATFQVKATGTDPLLYQWRRDGTPMAGATGNVLNIPNAQVTDAGAYDVVVKNDAGSVTSVKVILNVIVTPPTIITQPNQVVVGMGQTATFSVVASGSPPLQYQWRKNDVDLPGATQASYTTPPTILADDGTRFSVRVSNPAGSAMSLDGVLRVFLARTIQGQSGTLFESATGEVSVGRDLTQVPIEAVQPDGKGGFLHFPAQGHGDGTFTIPGVPPGPFFALVHGTGGGPTLGLWTTNESLDMRAPQAGRPGGVPAPGDQSALSVTIQGALAGQFSKLQTLVPNLGLVLDAAGGGPLYGYPWKGLPLVESSKDVVWVSGLKTQTSGPATTTSILGAMSLPAFSISDSSETRVNANVPPVAPSRSATWMADTNAYSALLPAVNPAVDPVLSRGPFRVDLLAEPYGFAVGPFQPWPTVLEYRTTFAGNLNSGALAYGDPFPAAWGRLVRLRQEVQFDLPIPGSSQVVHVSDAIQELWPLDSWPAGTRTPLLGPITQPKVGTASLFTPPSSVGLTPVLTWSTRTQDQTSYFIVSIYQVNPADGTLQLAAEIHTEVPNLGVPEGLLQAGNLYLVRIVDFQSTTYDPGQPWRAPWPLVSAPVYSAVLRP